AREAARDGIAVTAEAAAIAGADAALAGTAGDAALAAWLPEGAPILLSDPGATGPLLAAAPDLAARAVTVLGLLPQDRGRLVEVIPTEGGDAAAGAVLALLKRIGRLAVLARGPVSDPLRAALWAAADRAVEEGASPPGVDAALAGWGFAEGPFAMRDRIGLDRALPPPGGSVAERLWLALMERGRTGAAAGAGFFAWAPDGHDGAGHRRPQSDETVAALLDGARAAAGNVPRAVGADEIAMTALAALAATGARLVAAGAALRPSDIDVAAVAGLGFPRWRGGPMQAADEAGLLSMRNLLRDLARGEGPVSGALWEPVALWDELIREGRGFGDLNGG
ncbi:MAG: 3-hydroxyacyl-CoA dehydrogenase family protein, partial [Paracoccaceae bacterium]